MKSPAPALQFDIAPFETADVVDFASMITPRSLVIINTNWLRSCYELVYGTREVAYRKVDGEILTYASQTGVTLDDAMQIIGTPDILTWGIWMTLTQYLDEHARSISVDVSNGMDPTPWSAVSASVA